MFGFKAKRAAATAEACATGVHKRDGNAVSHEGGKLTAPCVHCGVTLTRTTSGWRTSSVALLPSPATWEPAARST